MRGCRSRSPAPRTRGRGPTRCCRRSGWGRAGITIHRSCRAASSSASPSRARSPTIRRFSSPTSPPATSIRGPGTRSSICCSRSTAAARRRWSSSRTTPSWRRWPTRRSRCATGASSDAAHEPRETAMKFVTLMALREIRASWRRLLFFFVCVAIGVGAIVLLRSIIQNVRGQLVRESRALIAADVVVATNRPWAADVRADLEKRFAAAPIQARQETIEVASMVRPPDREGAAAVAPRMVELRGVQDGFPFYGTVVLQDGAAFSHALLVNRGALVRPELLSQLGVAVGDTLLIGGQPFTIRGVIAQEPGRRVGAFSFGSRVLVDYDDLKKTGLLSFGSRASYRILLKMPEGAVDALTKQIREQFRSRFVNVNSFHATEDQIGDDLGRAENYLSLVGFIILVLGGIGVWSVTRVFVRQKIRSVAILKCLGATTRQVLAAYVLQVVFLGLSGSALGVAVARAGIAAIPERMAAALGASSYALTFSAVWQGVAVGILVSLLFSLVPLLEVRTVKPLLLLRGGTTGGIAGDVLP